MFKIQREYINRTAGNGHLMKYEVIGAYEDGSPKTDPRSAEHSDKCPCINALETGEWY